MADCLLSLVFPRKIWGKRQYISWISPGNMNVTTAMRPLSYFTCLFLWTWHHEHRASVLCCHVLYPAPHLMLHAGIVRGSLDVEPLNWLAVIFSGCQWMELPTRWLSVDVSQEILLRDPLTILDQPEELRPHLAGGWWRGKDGEYLYLSASCSHAVSTQHLCIVEGENI